MERKSKIQETDSDHKFNNLFLSSMLAMLICVCAFCSTSYAWFSASISSGENTLKSASFSLDITVTDAQSGIPIAENGGLYALLQGKRYCVTLEKSAEATASQGHCAVVIGDCIFCTEPFQADFVFFIQALTEVAISLDARIGYSAELDLIEKGDVLTLPI